MRALLAVIAIFAALYAGYWGIGHQGITRGLDQAETSLRADGATLTYGDRNVVGFPSRFDVTYTDVDIAQNGVTYSTPLAQVFTLSYKPNHVIAYAPGPHQIAGPFGTAQLAADDLRASVRVGANTDLPLAEARLTGKALDLSGDLGALRLGDLSLAIRAAGETTYDVFASAEALAPEALKAITANTAMPAEIDHLHARAQLRLDDQLDRHNQGDTHIDALRIDEAKLLWGDSAATVTGDLHFDQYGRADGSVSITATGLDPLLDMAQSQNPDVARLRPMIQSATDEDGQLNLIFTLKSGQIYFGLFPIGTLPPLL